MSWRALHTPQKTIQAAEGGHVSLQSHGEKGRLSSPQPQSRFYAACLLLKETAFSLSVRLRVFVAECISDFSMHVNPLLCYCNKAEALLLQQHDSSYILTFTHKSALFFNDLTFDNWLQVRIIWLGVRRIKKEKFNFLKLFFFTFFAALWWWKREGNSIFEFPSNIWHCERHRHHFQEHLRQLTWN